VIVTSKNQETDRIWGLRQGAVSFITKPVGDEELVAAVRANIKS
jgi:twitching motility two-component system response regulator PilH